MLKNKKKYTCYSKIHHLENKDQNNVQTEVHIRWVLKNIN